MRFSVGIPTTHPDALATAVKSILTQTWTELEVIVVGQGDHAALSAAVAAAAGDDSRVRYEALAERGVSLARNRVLACARGQVIAFTDDDCKASPRWLATIASGFDAHPGVGVVAGPVIAPELPRWRFATCPSLPIPDALYDPVASRRMPPRGWDWIGANFAIHAEVAARIGPFDPHLGAGAEFAAAEDTDYKLRLEAAGIRMLTMSAATVVHSGGVRHGLRAALRSQRDYARGNGALAAKLTLLGDPRGRAWLKARGAECLHASRHTLRRLPVEVRSYSIYRAAYQDCLDGFAVTDGLLSPRHQWRSAPRRRPS